MELIRKLERPTFEKTASKFILGDNPNTYPSELLAHLYKQHSYLGQYKVNMSIEGQDDSLGYMYGVFTVGHASEVPAGAGTQRMGEVIRNPEAEPSEEEKKTSLRIPIIVENKKAYSFDVFISPDGRFLPLNEQRVSAALFDMNPYNPAPAPTMTDSGLGSGNNFSPSEPASAHGGSATGVNATVKQASVLDSVAPGITSERAVAFLNKLANDRSLRDAIKLNPAFGKAVTKVAEAAEAGDHVEETAIRPMDEFDATVISKVDSGYKFKMASLDGTNQELVLTNSEASELPLEVRQHISNNGFTVIVPEENNHLVEVEKTANLKTVDQSGIYSVMTKTGKAQRAAIINEVMSLNGRMTDLCLVVGESGAAFQEKVAGVRCGDLDLASLNGSEPSGSGVFILKEAGVVTEPVTITNTVDFEGETSYLYEHPLQGAGSIKLASVTKPVPVSGNDYLFPKSATFIPLSFGGRYATDAVSVEKIASRKDRMMEVSVRSDGANFDFYGKPVESLTKTAGLDVHEAALVIGSLGDSPSGIFEKLASCKKNFGVSFVAKRVFYAKEKIASDKEVADLAKVINIDLVKESAALNSMETVDSVLSLNFITPENVQGYVDAIPTLEEASSKLAEMLVGVRLGLSDVPETAVATSLRGIERAVQGLKKLQIRASVSMA